MTIKRIALQTLLAVTFPVWALPYLLWNAAGLLLDGDV